MAKGKVDFFNDEGGYGFIEVEDTDEDIFFHMEDVGGPDLEEGQEVEFEIEEGNGGIKAKSVVASGSLPEPESGDAGIEEITSEIIEFLETAVLNRHTAAG